MQLKQMLYFNILFIRNFKACVLLRPAVDQSLFICKRIPLGAQPTPLQHSYSSCVKVSTRTQPGRGRRCSLLCHHRNQRNAISHQSLLLQMWTLACLDSTIFCLFNVQKNRKVCPVMIFRLFMYSFSLINIVKDYTQWLLWGHLTLQKCKNLNHLALAFSPEETQPIHANSFLK